VRSRQKIIDATLGLIESSGFTAVNVAAVAARAGVSRQTVYSIFGSREELVSQALAGLTLEMIETLSSVGEHCTTAVEHLIELIVAARRSVREHPLLASLLVGDTDNPLFDAGMMARTESVATQALTPILAQYPPSAMSPGDIAEMFSRLGISVILFESDAISTDDALRAFLNRWLDPAMTPLS
jgi:AcrR family transcriptional regulator